MRGGGLTQDSVHRRLAEFAAYLREYGVPVGTGAEVDLGRALTVLPPLDREGLREACAVILAKSPEQIAWVKEAFEQFFSPLFRRDGAAFPGQRSRPREARVGSGVPLPRTEGIEMEPATRETQIGIYSARAPGAGHFLTPLGTRPLLAFRRGARRFRRLTATLPGRRRLRSRYGEVDFGETVRRSVGRTGEWIELVRQTPGPRRTELVILWDVSGSMREHDARLFALVYSLERVSRTARVFAFSTHIEEITDELRRNGYPRAAAAVAARIAPAEGGTQIGACLHEFVQRYPAAIGDRATVVVVSDGWDRADASALGDELRRIQRRCHLVVWVSPYARRPGFEPKTAGLVAALPYTDLLLGPEDFRSSFPLPPIEWKERRAAASA